MKFSFDQVVGPSRAGKYGSVENVENPFKVWIFPDLIPDDKFKQLASDISRKIRLQHKYSDLFNFFQSHDINEFPQKNTSTINEFIESLQTDVRKHLEEICDVEIDHPNPLDITVSRYDLHNYLLCHNDHNTIKDRCRVLAYIYYLNSTPMDETTGGALSLFASDDLDRPFKIQQRIYPRPNTLVVFQTGQRSWHCVEECLSSTPTRLSINGWFNSTKGPQCGFSEKVGPESCPYSFYRPLRLTNKDLMQANFIINSMYLEPDFLKGAQKQFQKDGMIKLAKFFNPKVYDILSKHLLALSRRRVNQVHQGPASMRNYSTFKVSNLSPIAILVLRFLRSENFLGFLNDLTGVAFEKNSSYDENSKEDRDDSKLETFFTSQTNFGEPDTGEIEPSTDVWPYATGQLGDVVVSNTASELKTSGSSSLLINDDSDIKYLSDCSSDPETDDQKGLHSTCDISETQQTDKTGSTKRDLDRSPLERDSKRVKTEPKTKHLMRVEYRNYEQGSYTIMNDESFELFESKSIDLLIPFNSKLYGVNDFAGGFHSYLARDETSPEGANKEIVRILPEENSLNIIARKNNMRFFRYMSHLLPFKSKSTYQELNGVYYEEIELLPGNLR